MAVAYHLGWSKQHGQGHPLIRHSLLRQVAQLPAEGSTLLFAWSGEPECSPQCSPPGALGLIRHSLSTPGSGLHSESVVYCCLSGWQSAKQTRHKGQVERHVTGWLVDSSINYRWGQTPNRHRIRQTGNQMQLWTNLLPLKLHHSTGSAHTSGEGGRRVVLIVHCHREGHSHLLFVGTRAYYYALSLQRILLPKLPIQRPASAHLQAVWVTTEGQTVPCHQTEGNST